MKTITFILIMLFLFYPLILFCQSLNTTTKPLERNADYSDISSYMSFTALFGGVFFYLNDDAGPVSVKLLGVNYSITEEYTEWIFSIYGGISSPGFYAFPGVLGNIEYRIFGTIDS